MFGNLSGWHLVILIAIVVVLFGAPRLPALARSVGESMRIFRREVKTLGEESKQDAAPSVEGAAPDSTATVQTVPTGTTVQAPAPAPARTE